MVVIQREVGEAGITVLVPMTWWSAVGEVRKTEEVKVMVTTVEWPEEAGAVAERKQGLVEEKGTGRSW